MIKDIHKVLIEAENAKTCHRDSTQLVKSERLVFRLNTRFYLELLFLVHCRLEGLYAREFRVFLADSEDEKENSRHHISTLDYRCSLFGTLYRHRKRRK